MADNNAELLAHTRILLQDSALADAPLSTSLTGLLAHGGLEALAVPDTVPFTLSRFVEFRETAATLTAALKIRIQAFFSKLDSFEYIIPSPLISFLTHKPDGRLYTPPGTNDASMLPAAFTFIGQFIDHDLTKNAFELFADQTGTVQDIASPLIDLDSVYGPRSDGPKSNLFEHGRFKISPVGSGYDVPRGPKGEALIADGRNDENQLILQIHLLLMRLHNVLVRHHGMHFHAAQRETIFTWQSIILNDYLARTIEPATLQFVLSEIVKPGHGALLHKPRAHPAPGHLAVTMPHEFAIGFRFGHSQLRDHYALNSGNGFPLFNERVRAIIMRLSNIGLHGVHSMKMALVLIAPLLVCGASPSMAQDASQKIARSIINDLNTVSQHANREPLRRSDVAIIAEATCNSVQTARSGKFLERFTPELREKYPSDSELDGIDFEKFRAFEEGAFSERGASPATVALIARELKSNATLPKTRPAPNNAELRVLEQSACQRRDVRGPPEELASSNEAQVTGILVKGGVGLGVMVVDALVAASVVNPLTIVWGMASGGWGWNRIEEAVSELRALDKKT